VESLRLRDDGEGIAIIIFARLSVSLSDNVAADILLRLVGGPKAVNTYIAPLRVSGFHLQDCEAVLHHEVSAQYRNWFEPAGAVQLRRVTFTARECRSTETDDPESEPDLQVRSILGRRWLRD